ncbi:MAG: phytanoyl-CoA dioxygenase family protein [Halofilum sp. (in: g-proteobacteria)]
MTVVQTLNRPPAPDWLRARIYAGDLLIVRGTRATARLVAFFDTELRTAFACAAPAEAQFSMAPGEWHGLAARLRTAYRRDRRAAKLMRDLLADFGLDAARTAADALNLRAQPHDDDPGPDPRHTLGAHRDTWASNVYQQINWWLPIYPVTPGRTITFFPACWDRPIANDSADWDLVAIRAEVRAARREGRAPAIRNTPDPAETLDPSGSMPVVVEPGDVLIFSGAHLHASVPNASGATRFSLEMRSLDIQDAAAGLGAPNIDGAAPHTAWHWFRRLDTGERLPTTGPADADAGRS